MYLKIECVDKTDIDEYVLYAMIDELWRPMLSAVAFNRDAAKASFITQFANKVHDL